MDNTNIDDQQTEYRGCFGSPEEKAIAAPPENKAIAGPPETKRTDEPAKPEDPQ